MGNCSVYPLLKASWKVKELGYHPKGISIFPVVRGSKEKIRQQLCCSSASGGLVVFLGWFCFLVVGDLVANVNCVWNTKFNKKNNGGEIFHVCVYLCRMFVLFGLCTFFHGGQSRYRYRSLGFNAVPLDWPYYKVQKLDFHLSCAGLAGTIYLEMSVCAQYILYTCKFTKYPKNIFNDNLTRRYQVAHLPSRNVILSRRANQAKEHPLSCDVKEQSAWIGQSNVARPL